MKSSLDTRLRGYDIFFRFILDSRLRGYDAFFEFIRKGLLKRALGIALAASVIWCIVSVAVVPEAGAWWDNKWAYRKKVLFDASARGADIKENLTDIPVLVRLHTGNFNFANAKVDGEDLRFVGADDKSPLKYHIEKFDPVEEIALVWVKVPRIAGSSAQDTIFLYYGNPSAPNGQDSGGTYDVNHVAVFHLGEKEGKPRDATAYGNHAVAFNGKQGLPSVVGNGVQFTGAGVGMTIDESASLNFAKGFTFSAWIRLNQTGSNSHVFSWDDGNQSIIIGLDETRAYCSVATGKGQIMVTPKTTILITPRQWHHLAVTIDPNNRVTIYIDGQESVTMKLKGSVPAPATEISIAGSAKGTNAFFGDMDEVQLSNISRAPEWIKAAVHSQGPGGKLLSYTEEEAGGGSSESLTIQLMKVIVRAITLDGWIIIGVLAVMGAASTIIFTQKIYYLRVSRKANDGFSERFRNAKDPRSLADKDDEFKESTLYRVYKAGCEELSLWLTRKGVNRITGGAMSGFTAALEKASMLEGRKFSSGMIIINMSVAGGPFLGLLGTVWGVMNTFAGLAEAGEANLTAIAPGVASALACTLAGLLVAIPALFASAYITGQIKDMIAENTVFIDEFTIRMKEASEEKS